MRLSAQTSSHSSHAWCIFFTSLPITAAVVSSLSTVICVIRQKRNFSSLERSNHSLALVEWMWRLQTSASQTLASRKFNMFIDVFVCQIDFWPLRQNKGKLDSPRTGTLALDQGDPHAREDQLANRAPLSRRLGFEPSVQRNGNVDRSSDSLFLHKA